MTPTNAARTATSHAVRQRVVAGWFDVHVDRIHRFAARRVGAEQAHDITAETFRVALEQFDRFEAMRGSERAWLFGIANNLLRRHWRSQRRFLAAALRYTGASEDGVDPAALVDAQVDASRELSQVLDAVNRLGPVDRDLILLAAWERLSSAEISVILGIPPSTVRSRLGRVRSALRSSLEAST